MAELEILTEAGRLRAQVAKLRSGLRAVLAKVRIVHDMPPGAKERCPNHANRSQRHLCAALERGRSTLGDPKEE